MLLLDERIAVQESWTEAAIGGSFAERFVDTTTVFVFHSLDTLQIFHFSSWYRPTRRIHFYESFHS